ncbi:hypothetical protein EDB92DRAFT_1820653 [Lactarius akahatsu]|uniref:Uncharacterized protein n=1 Tax=Lactarius akahatsu TaxID=416441 RepID=A0AAD4L4R0_9AGAM|nr:hypothetical protein EDB92DRAFT_1820653 [Lactarius akahatsu]
MSDKDIAMSIMDHFDSACYGIRKALLLENKIRVPRPVISEYLKLTEPDAVDAMAHDKFKCYGLFFHVGLDPFPGVIHWCKVWWTVRNPKLITCFYLDTAWSIGSIPLITQSDPGTENVNVAYAHTALRHQMEPSLDGLIQHRDWAVGFQALLDEGVENGYYDTGDPLKCLVFRFVFIPFIQREVDAWVHQRNWTKGRADRKKVLPNGIPMIILQKPHKWKAADYKISIPPEALDEIEKKYAPPDDPIFDLVPHAFAIHANAVWTAMGSPQPQFDNVWEIYLNICDALRGIARDGVLQHVLSSVITTRNCLDKLPADLQPSEDELLTVEDTDDESGIPVIDLTEDKDHGEDNDSEGAFSMSHTKLDVIIAIVSLWSSWRLLVSSPSPWLSWSPRGHPITVVVAFHYRCVTIRVTAAVVVAVSVTLVVLWVSQGQQPWLDLCTPKVTNATPLCGTVNYLPPSMIDDWALDTLSYKFIVCLPPFEGISGLYEYKYEVVGPVVFPVLVSLNLSQVLLIASKGIPFALFDFTVAPNPLPYSLNDPAGS